MFKPDSHYEKKNKANTNIFIILVQKFIKSSNKSAIFKNFNNTYQVVVIPETQVQLNVKKIKSANTNTLDRSMESCASVPQHCVRGGCNHPQA